MIAPVAEQAVAAAVEAQGVPPTSPNFQALVDAQLAQLLPTLRWVLEAADPLYAPRWMPANVGVVTQVVTGDDVLPDLPLHEGTTQSLLASAFGEDLDQVTYTMVFDDAGVDTAICDDPVSQLGSLLQPCASDATRGPLAFGQLAGMRRQLATFLVAGVVCPPDITETNAVCF
jgi:hypothetical protein